MKTPIVEKAIPTVFDLGNLAIADSNPIVLNADSIETDLYALNRDNVQLLVNQILQLPLKRTVDSINSSNSQNSTMTLFSLPEPLWQTPREKPVPKDKAKTRWELFAAKKGIQKRAKDGKLVFDEETKKWIPKWGYNGANKKADKQWLVEYDDKNPNTDETIDPRILPRAQRKQLVKKSLHQQKKNAKANA